MANFNIFGKPYNDTTCISLIDTNDNTHEFYDYESFGTKTITSNGEYSPWDDGYSAYSSVTVNVSGGGSPSLQNKSVTPALYAQVVQADSGYDGLGTVAVGAMPSGTAGTPTATKGTVSNHSVSVTPKVTNTTGYITGSTKTGTAVTVSASELVSGSETKTSNGTYDVTNLAQLVVNVPSGSSKNVQVAQSTTSATTSTYTNLISLTCSVTGTYTVRWSTFRSSTSGTWGSQLYINDTAYGTAETGGWSGRIQNITLTGVSLTANQTVAVYVRTRGSNYYGYVGTLVIEQTA